MARSFLLTRLWTDDRGTLLSTEFMLMATILVIGVIAGLVMVRDAVVVQMEEFGMAIDCLPILSPDDAEDTLEGTGSLTIDCAPGPDSCSTLVAVPPTPCNIAFDSCP